MTQKINIKKQKKTAQSKTPFSGKHDDVEFSKQIKVVRTNSHKIS